MKRGKEVLLQDVSQLINIDHTHILFDRGAFKTEFLLNYKENLVTFCSTSENPVSQSLKALLPEISSRLSNLHSDVNGRQNISMNFLCSGFFKLMIMLLL